MAKGYWIGRVDVHNDEGFKPYSAANPAILKKFGARYVVRGGKFNAVGPLIGAVRKATGGQADAATVRAILLAKLGAQ